MTPAQAQLRLEQLEEGELSAESLTEVVAPVDVKDDNLELMLSTGGKLRTKKGKQEVPPPRDSEDFRHRYKTMAACWAMVKCRHPHRSFLKDLTEHMWRDHVDWLLGPKVRGFKIKSADGHVTGAVP